MQLQTYHDEMSETAKWLVIFALGRVSREIWSSENTPDFTINISGEDVNPDEFFTDLAERIDGWVERRANKIAAEKLDEHFANTSEDLCAIQMEFRQRFIEKLGIKYSDVFE